MAELQPYHFGLVVPDVAELEARGFRREAWDRGDDGAPSFFAYLVAPSGYRVELVTDGYRHEYETAWSVERPVS